MNDPRIITVAMPRMFFIILAVRVESGNCFSGKAPNEQIMLYDVMYAGQPCAYIERQPGPLEITLPAATINGKLSVRKRSRS